MKLNDMPEHIKSFVSSLIEKGLEVWLIGSRANPTEKTPADWDFIIFADEAVLEDLSNRLPILDVDALVVFNGDEFRSPWSRTAGGKIKGGSLSNWNWQKDSEDSATYEGTKWPHDWGTVKRAIRIRV